MRNARDLLLRPGLGALVVLLALAAAASGQQEEEPEAAGGRGWIGITFSYDPTARGPEGADAPQPIRIDDVFEGSPADRAGLRAGDSIVSVDGAAVDPEGFRRFGTRLRPGQTVRVTLQREGETREVELEAAERPSLARSFLPPEVVVQLDSLRDALLRRFDSLRIRLRYERTEERRRAFASRDSSDDPARMRRADDGAPVRVDGVRDLPAAGRLPPPTRRGSQGEPPFRTPSPHLLGLSFVAGAQLTALNADLSDYFQVERGVLVTAVLEETPADEAGLRPGDVIVSVRDTTCASVECVRRALLQVQEWPVSLRVVRKQEEIEIRLAR